MKKVNLVIVMLAFCVSGLSAQVSLLEDDQGEGAFKVGRTLLSINTSANKISFSYFKPIEKADFRPRTTTDMGLYTEGSLPRNTRSDIYDTVKGTDGKLHIRKTTYPGLVDRFGFNINANANNGVSNIIEGGKVNANGSLGLFYVDYGVFIPAKSISEWDFLSYSLRVESINADLVDTANLINGSSRESSVGFKAEIAYNRVGFAKVGGGYHTTIFGMSVSYNLTDNANELRQSKFLNTTTISNTGNQTITQSNEINGYINTLYQDNVSRGTFNIDYGIYPKKFDSRLLLAVHWRSRFQEALTPVSNAGFGVYIAKKDAPSRIIGGINAMINDFFGVQSNNPLSKRVVVNLVAGINL